MYEPIYIRTSCSIYKLYQIDENTKYIENTEFVVTANKVKLTTLVDKLNQSSELKVRVVIRTALVIHNDYCDHRHCQKIELGLLPGRRLNLN